MSNLLGEKTNAREWVLEQSNTRVLSVRTQKWKYIEPSDGPKMIQWGPKIETGNNAQPQLFDMQASNFEEKNVAKDHPQVVYDMQNILRRERSKK